MRAPHGHVPGWFPLVVERVHPRLRLSGEVRESVDGISIYLDLSEYTQRRVFYRCHESREIRFTARFLRPGDRFLDVGAHVGLFTLVAARRIGPTGEVHSFEPLPSNFRVLSRNVAANAFDWVTLNEAAVADEDGSVALGLDDAALAGVSTGGFTIRGRYEALRVRSVKLDTYLGERARRGPVRLVKIDVEGHEPRAFESMRETLAVDPPDAIMFEYNADSLASHGFSPDSVARPLLDAGYELFRFHPFGRLAHVDALPSAPPSPPPAGALRAGVRERKTLLNVLALRPTAISAARHAAR